MKTHRLIFLLALMISSLFISFVAKGQSNYEDVVYLKNGEIYRGMIIEQIPNTSIKIKTNDQDVYLFKLSEIEKITKEPVQIPLHKYSIPVVDNIKRHGGTVIIEVGYDRYDFSEKHITAATCFQTSVGYLFNPYFSAAVGAGLEKTLDEGCLPMFADLRYNILYKTVSPYIAEDVGYSYGFGSNNLKYKGGLLINSNVGLKVFVSNQVAFNFSIGYKYMKYKYQFVVYHIDPNHTPETLTIKGANKFLNLNFGVTI